jgi:hypothetical protein
LNCHKRSHEIRNSCSSAFVRMAPDWTALLAVYRGQVNVTILQSSDIAVGARNIFFPGPWGVYVFGMEDKLPGRFEAVIVSHAVPCIHSRVHGIERFWTGLGLSCLVYLFHREAYIRNIYFLIARNSS